MERLNLYPEMNKEIVNIFRLSPNNPMHMYAAQLIEEQAAKIAELETELQRYRELNEKTVETSSS